ncbi:hypothetical protein CCP4SC76_5140002 [Gammaproteobacteria bacterium]
MTSREIFALRKSGRLDEVLAMARQCYEKTPEDLWLQRAYGWVIHDCLKRDIGSFEAKHLSSGTLTSRLNHWLTLYRQFGEKDRPGILYSQIIRLAIKGSKVWPGFLDFARWWDKAYFQVKDKEPFVTSDGPVINSLQQQYLHAIGREIVARVGKLDLGLLAWGESQLAEALKEHPDDQWLHYYTSKLLLNRNQCEEARQHLLPVVRRQGRAAWVWGLLGHTFDPARPDQAITCYSYAIHLATSPQEVAKTHIALATLLVNQQRFDQAATQVREALKYREGPEHAEFSDADVWSTDEAG